MSPKGLTSRKSNTKNAKKKPVALNFSHHEDVENIIGMMKRHGLASFELAKGNSKISLSFASGSLTAPQVVQSSLAFDSAPSHTQGIEKTLSAPVDKNLKTVVSPFVGTFYRAPSPQAEVYVREGQIVKPGDVLCIIEAMKLMNEIECEHSGKIVSILVENGQPVEFGEPLFTISTS